MPQPRERVRLEDGLKLDLYRLMRQGSVRPGGIIGSFIQWTNSYTGRVTARAHLTSHLRHDEGSFRIECGSLDQRILLQSRPRHFGGRQWFFLCPITGRRASVLWKPPGAIRFASRYAWPRSVAYASQFETPKDRAWRGQGKIKSRLIADLDPDEWDLPPKPKWMRFATYNRYEAKFDHYESILDLECVRAAVRLLKR